MKKEVIERERARRSMCGFVVMIYDDQHRKKIKPHIHTFHFIFLQKHIDFPWNSEPFSLSSYTILIEFLLYFVLPLHAH